MGAPVVELSGQCKLQFKTGSGGGTCKITINKTNNKGENGADGLINEVFHFGIMRHGKNKMREMLEEKLSDYPDHLDKQGIK